MAEADERAPKSVTEWTPPPAAVLCRHCFEPIWQGLIWLHIASEDGRCWDGKAFAEPVRRGWHPPGGSI